MTDLKDEVKHKLDIVQLIGETVTLKKTGKNYSGFCPFHDNTNTPALAVFPDTQTWSCFGACGIEGGDIFTWTMKRNGQDFKHALAELAHKAGLNGHQAKPARRVYTGLADYATAHGVPAEVFQAAGWAETTRYDRPALVIKTDSGPRWRYLDDKHPKYIHAAGFQRCWYLLAQAADISHRTGHPLVICNGEASTIAGQHFGLAAVAVAGGSEKPTLPQSLLKQLKKIYEGPVIVALDCDKAGRDNAPRLAQFLTQAGLAARAIDLGLGNDGQDLADFCKLHRHEALDKLLGAATLPDPAPAGAERGPNGRVLGPPNAGGPGRGGLNLGQPGAAPGQPGGPNPEEGLTASYALVGEWIVYTTYKQVKDDIIAVKKYFPFYGQVTQKITLFDEGVQSVIYTIEGKKDGKPYTAEVTAQEFADGNRLYPRLLNYLPGKPPAIDPPLVSRLATAIASITDIMAEVKAITSTGWTPDGAAYVLPAGGVGQSDYQCKINPPEIAREFMSFGLKRNTPEENKIALDALLSLSEVYRVEVIYTLLAHAFLPPLLRWLGDEARYLYHIHADTGSFKTELGKLIMSLYGPTGSQAITYKWSGTPYGAEGRAHVLKDCLMLIDDLKPGTISNDALPKWVSFIQAAVDAQGRKRATMTGKAAASLPPRALLLSTGEAVPEAGEASYSARMLLAQLAAQPAGERNKKLDEIKSKSHLFSGLMAAYIEWLLAGDGRAAQAIFREFQADGIKTEHTRLSNNYAANSTGAALLTKFCRETGLMSGLEADLFQATHYRAITEIIERTGEKVKSERYSWKFLAALRDAITSGFAVLSDSAVERRVGWKEAKGKYVYLLSCSFEIVNQWLRTSGQTPINISKAELRKQLFQDGLSRCTKAREDAGWYDYQIVDPATQTRPLVIALVSKRFDDFSNRQQKPKEK